MTTPTLPDGWVAFGPRAAYHTWRAAGRTFTQWVEVRHYLGDDHFANDPSLDSWLCEGDHHSCELAEGKVETRFPLALALTLKAQIDGTPHDG